ncbi:hypothetical protein Taro_056758 [Colocasia esculenta]|uniref:Uncharacterized protein n=1 Tax=Colocasia esculenta TaxID=4460 RepID=A0A843XXG7_COLES|nr:hypothetical protein [Colocasia esculenta]
MTTTWLATKTEGTLHGQETLATKSTTTSQPVRSKPPRLVRVRQDTKYTTVTAIVWPDYGPTPDLSRATKSKAVRKGLAGLRREELFKTTSASHTNYESSANDSTPLS